ncbi:HTH-type transcriptional regulator McbR [Ruegeria denitrificans]|uniref:HTH-type transcriptional regulator McbR n=1 Tax=Ruegeria denitrificans TaxID=1715692 RepID=A0A0P1IK89_9RHOB|nr:GntR family transcriptional regulator [Ruegeria denitrificans]CUK18816.1 HTH-type transcriptional regulator McbR [Ruegeria denitrificans]
MNHVSDKKPEHETIYVRVKEMILFGEFIPGQPITILGLSESIGAGVTPVREAIRRLTAEGALRSLKNRRVEVPEMSDHRLSQIELVRMSVEPALATMAAANIDDRVIAELEQIDTLVDKAIDNGDTREYLAANYQFHFTLYEAADALILQRIAESLWLQVGPSLRVVCGRYGTAKLLDQHREATLALREGDTEKVKKAIEEDIRQGLALVRQTLRA